MSKKLLQATLGLAMVSLAAYKDMFDEDLHMRQSDTSPYPQISTQERTLFRYQGQTDNGYVSQGRN